MKDKCYMCGEDAINREHVPPLCLFPEEKDLGIKLRYDLITVPSCEKHNSKKSKDDEFLLTCIAGNILNNKIGILHNLTKVKRALARKKTDFMKSILRNAKFTEIQHDNHLIEAIYGFPDSLRLVNCFKHIAYGLYYYEFNNIFQGKCNIFLGFLRYRRDNDEKQKILISTLFAKESANWEIKGKNPEVFQYQFGPIDQFGLIPLRMLFYEGTEVFAAFQPENVEIPYNLAYHLIQSGMKVFVNVGDDKHIEFN